MTKDVEFLWWSSSKTWKISGKDIDEIIEKCEKLCAKYHAIHYQVLN